jgi:ketosteroid isomerase-like protein
MNNVDILKIGYRHFAEGNIPAVLELFDPGIVWDECSGFPFVEGDGIYVGPQAVVDNIFAQIPEHYDGFVVEIDELFGSGDKVVMVGHYKGTWKATGKAFVANATHVWEVKNGKATRFFQAVDTAEIINP